MAFKSTSSRFAFLSDDASDPFEPVKKGKNKAANTVGDGGAGNKTGNKQNKNKKKSSTPKDSNSSNSNNRSCDKQELLSMAFGLKSKSQPAQSSAQSSDPTSNKKKIAHGDHVEADNSQESPNRPVRPVGMNDAQWAEWQQRDIEYVSGTYESDLEAALIQSKLDFQQQQSRAQQESQSKAKSKKKPVTVPIMDFNAMLNSGAPLLHPPAEPKPIPDSDWSPLNGVCSFPDDKEMEKIRLEAQMEMRREQQLEIDRQLLQSRANQVEDRFLLQNHSPHGDYKCKSDALELAQCQMEKMELEKELEISKARFKKLWSVVHNANLKDKVYLSAEVEKLTQLNQHLTDEISTLHSQLEQERSRSHAAVLECRKLEQSRRRATSTTEVN